MYTLVFPILENLVYFTFCFQTMLLLFLFCFFFFQHGKYEDYSDLFAKCFEIVICLIYYKACSHGGNAMCSDDVWHWYGEK